MVRDYETPSVPRAWESFARSWATRLGLSDIPVTMTCSPDRYGIPIVLRVVRHDGVECISTRRGSDAEDAAERRQKFLRAVNERDIKSVELDAAGYFVGEGSLECSVCPADRPHEEWQHAIIRELLRVAQPPGEPAADLSPDDADDAERSALDRKVGEILASS